MSDAGAPSSRPGRHAAVETEHARDDEPAGLQLPAWVTRLGGAIVERALVATGAVVGSLSLVAAAAPDQSFLWMGGASTPPPAHTQTYCTSSLCAVN